MAFTSCGGTIYVSECEWFEAGGLSVCSLEPIDPAEVEELILVLQEELLVRFPNAEGVADMLQDEGVTATFLKVGGLAQNCHETGYDNLYACDKLISGQNRDGVEIIATYRKCLADTSLAHEILHSVQFFILESSEDEMMNHSTPWLFAEWGWDHGQTWNTVDDMIWLRLRDTLPSCQ